MHKQDSNPVVEAMVSKYRGFFSEMGLFLMRLILGSALSHGQHGVVSSLVGQRYRDLRMTLVVDETTITSAGWQAYRDWRRANPKARLPNGMTPQGWVDEWISRYCVCSFWGDLLVKDDSWQHERLGVLRASLAFLRPDFDLDGECDGTATFYDDTMSSDEDGEYALAALDMDEVDLFHLFRSMTDIDDTSSGAIFAEDEADRKIQDWRDSVINSAKPGIGRALPEIRTHEMDFDLEDQSHEHSASMLKARNGNQVSILAVFVGRISKETKESGRVVARPVLYKVFKSARHEPYENKHGELVEDFSPRVPGIDKTAPYGDQKQYGVYVDYLSEDQVDLYSAKERIMSVLRTVEFALDSDIFLGRKNILDDNFNRKLNRPFIKLSVKLSGYAYECGHEVMVDVRFAYFYHGSRPTLFAMMRASDFPEIMTKMAYIFVMVGGELAFHVKNSMKIKTANPGRSDEEFKPLRWSSKDQIRLATRSSLLKGDELEEALLWEAFVPRV